MVAEYERRLQEAVDYIESHLDANLSVPDVAREVGYSGFHFHRIFRGLTGESIKDYIKKRRLFLASSRLVESPDAIGDIAIRAGFESQAAFTRAFKRMFGITPASFRRRGRAAVMIRERPFSLDLIEHLKEGVTMEPVFKERGAEKIIGLAGTFSEDCFEGISKLWSDFEKRAGDIEGRRLSYSLGVCLESHPQVEVKAPDTFIYVAGVAMAGDAEPPEGLVAVSIPPSRYAVFTHRGPIDTITHTVNYIWGTWIPRNSEIYKKGPDFELYDDRFDSSSLSGEVDIYVPVR